MKKTLNFIMAVTTGLSTALLTAIMYYSSILPDSFYVNENTGISFSDNIPVTAVSEDITSASTVSTGYTPDTATLKLFGLLPLKQVNVIPSETPMLIPGGTPFGIKIMIDGVMVIGVGEVNSENGMKSPASEAGIETGDIILSISGQEVTSNEDIQEIISESDGKSVEITAKRNQKEIEFELTPAFSKTDNCYQAGIWVRDSSAGIGTVTFYEASTGLFGGLGHPVCDTDTGEIIPISRGEVADVDITGIKKSVEGHAGELQGMFTSSKSQGQLFLNNEYGIFGTLDKKPEGQAIPMALKQEIKTGEAKIITTVEGEEPQEYSIVIEKIDYSDDNTNKNMVIRVTDEKLLSLTGGIVQGMSGSPIIQNGKLIGAVTHVFVNEPERGYAVFCENMYQNSLK